jgi:chromosome partitioning protein
VGSRIDARTHGEQALRQWALSLGLPFIGSLRAAQIYVRCVERGLTIFDAPEAKAQGDRALWQPILDWLAADLDAPAPAAVPSPAPAAPAAARPPALARMGSQPRPLPLNEVLVRPPLAVLRTSDTAGPWAGMRRLVGLLLPPRRA